MNTNQTEFYRAFADRVRETVSPVDDEPASETTTHRSVDAYLSREYPNLFPPAEVETEKPARQWTITTKQGARVSGYLPPWSRLDPTTHNIAADRLEMFVSDVTHTHYWDGQLVDDANLPSGKGRYRGEAAILCPQMNLQPFSDDPRDLAPTVSVELVEGGDDWIEYLDPEALANFAARLHAAAERLTNEVLPALVSAREDWAKNSGAK